MNTYLLAIPLQSIYKDPYYAMMDLATNLVTIYPLDSDQPLDTFTSDEYYDMIDNGTLDKETRRITINW